MRTRPAFLFAAALWLTAAICAHSDNFDVPRYSAGTNITITGTYPNQTINSSNPGGTVTSAALSMPGIFSVTGSPITSSGTFSVSLANQSANTIFAGPSSGAAGAPLFRPMVIADIPTGTSGATVPLNNGANTWSQPQTFNGSSQPATFKADNAAGAQILVTGNSNTNKQLYLGYNTTGDYGVIQAILQGTAAKPLFLNGGGGPVGFGLTTGTGNTGEIMLPKISASGSAPGAAVLKLAAVAGTNAGTCKIIAYAGTSTTPTTLVDNVGSGC